MSAPVLDHSETAEKKGRENEPRRVVGRTVYAALPDHERERLGEWAEGDTQEWTDRVLRALHSLGLRLCPQSPRCGRCGEALEQEGQPWRDYLESDELQEYLESDKQQRIAAAEEYRRKLEESK